MTPKNKALILSFLRVLLGCFITAYTAVAGAEPPWGLTGEEWQKIGNALWGATLVTVVNYFRSGETRFGRGAKNMGMGGEDTVTPPDGKIVTPEGEVEPPAEAFQEEKEMPVLSSEPRPGDLNYEEPTEFVEEPEAEPLNTLTSSTVRSIPIREAKKAAKKVQPAKAIPAKKPTKKTQKPL